MPTTPSDSSAADDWIIKSRAPADDTIGPYRKLGKLGSGGMGDVYRVRDEKLGRDIALKLARPSPFGNVALRSKTEINVLKSVNHDNIVRLLGIGEHDGQPYFTMEYIDGLSLSELLNKVTPRTYSEGLPATEIRKIATSRSVAELMAPLVKDGKLSLLGGPMGDLSPDAPAYMAAIRIVQQVASALDWVHHHKIIHRDVKPSNVMLKANGRALLTDFGIAHVPRPSESGRTRTGDFLGTERYAAPEQHRGEAVDERTDVYGLGAILYELVTGVPLFHDAGNREVIAAAFDRPPRDPRVFAPKIPEKLRDVILKALAKDPARRHASAMEFAQALQDVISPPPPTLMDRGWQRSVRLLAAFFIMGLGATVGAAFAIHYRGATAQSWLPHPLLASLAPLVIGVGVGLAVGGLCYVGHAVYWSLTRLRAWIRRR